MRKNLFLDDTSRKNLQLAVNQQLRMKNHLLKVLFENDDHKLKSKEFNALSNKYQEQIIILDLIQSKLYLGATRKHIQEINQLITHFEEIENDRHKLE